VTPGDGAPIVVMGVSGAGKSAVGRTLADALGRDFLEADALHSAANLAKMARGEPLDDADRAPWLAAVAAEIRRRLVAGRAPVVACSALKAAYRDVLRVEDGTRFVLLALSEPVLRARMTRRTGHFMPASLLASQLATLERTPDLLVVDGEPPIDEVVGEIVRRL
jgi:carbohydrate kinase (thermoresistant glucokinase family)